MTSTAQRPVVERFIVMRNSTPGRRFWRGAATALGSAPERFVPLIEDPEAVITLDPEEVLAVDAWRLAAGLSKPPVGVFDREAKDPELKAAAEDLALGLRRFHAVRALHLMLFRDGGELILRPVGGGDWECSHDDLCETASGATPQQAVAAFIDLCIAIADPGGAP